jgi:hypothetical protein
MFSSFLYLFKNRDFQLLKVLSSDVEFSALLKIDSRLFFRQRRKDYNHHCFYRFSELAQKN